MARQPHKIDVDYGPDLAAYLRQLAAVRGVPAGAVARGLIQEARLRDSLHAAAVTDAVLAVARATAPDCAYDPADDPRQGPTVLALAALLGSLPAAEGVASALAALWAEWALS